MNEIEILRDQLAAERLHAAAVANACAGALSAPATSAPANGANLAEFRQACVDYLVCVLAWFEERDQRLADLVRRSVRSAPPARAALEEALARPGRSREALGKLEAACAAATAGGCGGGRQRSWQEFARYFNGTWSTRRAAVDALLGTLARAADWRAVAGIDADSILEERRRYARVGATLPAGVTLTPPDPNAERVP
jgi:hypothetical protein